jgi:hypothetical protein
MADNADIFPPALASPLGRTACNNVGLCQQYHWGAFILYILILVVVIVLVWIANNGTISLFNSAVANTVLVAIVIGLMFIHWFWFLRGVIPVCPGFPAWLTLSAGVRTSAAPPAALVSAGMPAAQGSVVAVTQADAAAATQAAAQAAQDSAKASAAAADAQAAAAAASGAKPAGRVGGFYGVPSYASGYLPPNDLAPYPRRQYLDRPF